MIEDITNEELEPTFEEFTERLIGQFKKADHFYIVHYCKKRDDVEERRCYWDEKSKIWMTSKNKLAITCVALDNEEHTIDGYRTFTNIFTIRGYVPRVATSEGVH